MQDKMTFHTEGDEKADELAKMGADMNKASILELFATSRTSECVHTMWKQEKARHMTGKCSGSAGVQTGLPIAIHTRWTFSGGRGLWHMIEGQHTRVWC